MKIVVLIKEVPDTYGDRKLNLETGLAERGASDRVLDEIGERALEVALKYADTHPDTEVVVMSLAPQDATTSIRKSLAMGASSAVHVTDPSLLGADMGLTAQVLAAAIGQAGPDLVIAGNQSTDGGGGMVATMIAEILDYPQLTNLSEVEITPESVSGARLSDGAITRVSAGLPAVVSITETSPEVRFPNFKGIMAAKKKPIDTVTLSDLGIDPDNHSVSRSIMISVAERPPRQAGTRIVDEGQAAALLADYLVQNRLV